MKKKPPKWKIPKNLQKLVEADADNMWEDDRWYPILLTVMGGTSYRGRDIPLAWQIEFEPDDKDFEDANEKIAAAGIDVQKAHRDRLADDPQRMKARGVFSGQRPDSYQPGATPREKQSPRIIAGQRPAS